MPKARSKAEARLLGAIAGGKSTKAAGMTPAEAKARLEGVKVAKLPAKAQKKGKKGY